VTVRQAGVDTWSPAWYVGEDSPAERALRHLATTPSKRGQLIPDPIGGHRVGWFPSSRLVYAEGHPGGDRLASPDRLVLALDRLHADLADVGIPLDVATARSNARDAGDNRPGFAGLRRLDSTVDLHFDSAVEGLAVLAGVAAIGIPRAKVVTWRAPVRVPAAPPSPIGEAHMESLGLVRRPIDPGRLALETVAFYGHSGKKMLARFYDKGVEGNLAPRGRLIRPEDQRRYTAATRRDVDELTTRYVREQFRRRFVPLWRASKGVTVAGPMVLAEKLAAAVADGEVTAAMAERLAGHVILEEAGCASVSRASRYRRRSKLRELGLVSADLGLDEVEVDVHEVLERALEAEEWGG
jgi:hypothetical protein